MTARGAIDWEAIEREYRIGQKSIRTLAAEHNVSHQAISKRAKKAGWVQDKSKEIREKTRAALASCHPEVATTVATPTREDIDKAVLTNIEVIRGHRSNIVKAREVVALLMSQLQDAAASRERLGNLIAKGEDSPQAKAGMRKAVNLPAHAGVVRDLSTALKNLITLERQAFNLDEPGALLEDVLAALPGPFRDRVREALAKSVS